MIEVHGGTAAKSHQISNVSDVVQRCYCILRYMKTKSIILVVSLALLGGGCTLFSKNGIDDGDAYKPPIYFFDDPLPSISDLPLEFQEKISSEDRAKAIKYYSDYKQVSYTDAEKLLEEKGLIERTK